MKMPTERIDTAMFAPCGMNCMVCYQHCNHKKPCAGCFNSDMGKQRIRRSTPQSGTGKTGIILFRQISSAKIMDMPFETHITKRRYAAPAGAHSAVCCSQPVPVFQEYVQALQRGPMEEQFDQSAVSFKRRSVSWQKSFTCFTTNWFALSH